MSPGTAGLSLLRLVGRALARLPAALSAAAAVAWAGLIWVASSTSLTPGRPSFSFRVLANLTHAPSFGLLALLLAAALVPRPAAGGPPGAGASGWRPLGPFRNGLVILLTTGYGVLDEWHQSTTPGRHSSARDVLTDLVGALCVVWIVAYLGSPRASGPGLGRRLGLGLLACLGCALLSSLP